MYILGIDTATRVAGAAVVGEGRLIAERFVHNLKTHSQNIMPIIQQVMEDSELKPHELHGIAVTGGPGSFTGLRIGMSVAKTMGQVLNIPVVGISTLQALAWNAVGIDGLICPLLDARKQEAYTCLYKSVDGGLLELVGPAALGIDKLTDILLGYESQVTFLGDGVPVFRDVIAERLGSRASFGTMINSYPRAGAVAELGLAKIKEGGLADATFMQPVYLRKSEAELSWEEKHGDSICGHAAITS